MNAALNALRSDIADDRAALARRLDQAVARPAAMGDDADLAYVALALQHAYSAIESILERVVRHLDGALPTGTDSHRALLARAARTIEGVRPAILSVAALSVTRDLLRFRHFLRHDYGAELEPAQLARIQDVVVAGRPTLDGDLDAFDAWLAAVAAAG